MPFRVQSGVIARCQLRRLQNRGRFRPRLRVLLVPGSLGLGLRPLDLFAEASALGRCQDPRRCCLPALDYAGGEVAEDAATFVRNSLHQPAVLPLRLPSPGNRWNRPGAILSGGVSPAARIAERNWSPAFMRAAIADAARSRPQCIPGFARPAIERHGQPLAGLRIALPGADARATISFAVVLLCAEARRPRALSL